MYKKTKDNWTKHLDFFASDAVGIVLSFVIAYLIRHATHGMYLADMYQHLCALVVLIDLCVGFFMESYSGILRRGYFQEFKQVVRHTTVVVVISFAYMFFNQNSEQFSRLFFIYLWGIAIAVIYGLRLLVKKMIKSRHQEDDYRREILVVSTRDRAEALLHYMKDTDYQNYRISGFVLLDETFPTEKQSEPAKQMKDVGSIPIVCAKEDILSYIQEHVVDEVLLNLPAGMAKPEEFLENCRKMGITIHIVLAELTEDKTNTTVEELANYMVLTSSIKMASPKQLLYKRLLDIAGGLVGSLITVILMIFVAPIIKIQSPGPIFFKQVRVGKNGRRFKIYKFRSMYMDAEERKKELMAQNEMKGLMFKMENDPRIFPFGHFLRDFSIDEFPQFFNVLKGDMSLVGTRPPTEDEWEQYDLHHRARLAIKPGLTGMWQVSGRSDITDFEEVVALDTKYIAEWSFGLDLKILFKTVMIVLKKEGAK